VPRRDGEGYDEGDAREPPYQKALIHAEPGQSQNR
jgi:hypothetical protein